MSKNEMIRKDRELNAACAREILQEGKYGVLSVMGEDGYAYGVPLHYVIIDDCLYFHCSAKGGYKIDCITYNPKISFTVIQTDDGIKCTSAIFFGTAVAVPAMKEEVLEKFIEKFVPPVAWEQAKKGIPLSKDAVYVYKLNIEQLSAKYIDKPSNK